jgi:serine/threonine protein kinase
MAPDAPAAFIPSTFGRYELLERLAIGGMAEIFRARQTGLHGFEKIFVIKRILPHLAADPEFLGMFIDEAKLQCALEHPNIVQVYEFGEVSGQYYIALEYVDGMDALGLLRACAYRHIRLPVRIAIYIVCEVLDALAYAHEKAGIDGRRLGIVHRDVSPSNVYISRRGDVKLGDFGIARATELQRHSKTQSGTLKGKYGYMAPEQVVGANLDGRADVFAVGIMLAEMLMGRRLFTAPNDLDVLLMVRDARLDRLNQYGGDLATPLRALVDRALTKAVDARYQSARAMREALLEYLRSIGDQVSAIDLGTFVEGILRQGPPVEGQAVESLMGENTRVRAEAAAHRKAMLEALSAPSTQTLDPDLVEEIPIVEEISAPHLQDEALPLPGPAITFSGGLHDSTPVRLFARLAATRETGQLVIERGAIVKEIFLVEGAPEFISSNVPSERFGEYLVQHDAISPGELSMALAVLPRFKGKLGDTLVGLNLLRPLEVFRYLTRQVREKMIDVFAWTDGSFHFYRGVMNSRESFPLGLDAFEIIGAGVAGLPLQTVRARLERVAHLHLRRVERTRPTPESFRVGPGPRELWQRLDGRRSIRDWMRRYEQPDQLLTLCRTLYLLLETELAELDQPPT